MSHLSITQSYMLCALNPEGKFPYLSAEIPVCVLAGSVLDLIIEKNVAVRNKKLDVISSVNSSYPYLQSVYDFIAKKRSIKLDALASEYCFSISNKKINALIHDIGESLVEKQYVTLQRVGGVFGNKDVFIPNEDAVDGIVQMIRAEILEEGSLSDEIVALTSLMEKSRILKKYFSSYEKKLLKARLGEIKNSSSHKIVGQLVDYITDMTAVMVTSSFVN